MSSIANERVSQFAELVAATSNKDAAGVFLRHQASALRKIDLTVLGAGPPYLEEIVKLDRNAPS